MVDRDGGGGNAGDDNHAALYVGGGRELAGQDFVVAGEEGHGLDGGQMPAGHN